MAEHQLRALFELPAVIVVGLIACILACHIPLGLIALLLDRPEEVTEADA